MDMFDKLNRETNIYNAHNTTRHIGTAGCANNAPKYGTNAYWQNYWNNQTYKANNGSYSNHYSCR